MSPRKPWGLTMRHSVYYIDTYINGVRVRESTNTSNQAEALSYLARRIKELSTVSITVNDLLTDYENKLKIEGRFSYRSDAYRFERLRRIFGNLRAEDVTLHVLTDYAATRDVARATVNREFAVLRRAFTYGVELGNIPTVPTFPRFKENGIRKGFFTSDEVDRLIVHLPEYLRRCRTIRVHYRMA